MTSPLFEPEDDEAEWGHYTATPPVEPDGERLRKMQDAKAAGAKLWEEVQALLRQR